MKAPTLELDSTFLTFLDAAPDAIVMVDDEGRIVAVNALTEAMFGYSREELGGQRIELLIPPRFHDNHKDARTGYVRTPHTRPMGLGRDLWGRRKSGEEFPVQISLSPIETQQRRLITSIIRDVTALRAAEARFRGLLEAAPDGIVVLDSKGAICIVNSQTERMFGYTREELIGQPIELLVPERYRGRHIADRDQYLGAPKTRPMGAGRSLTGLTKDGREIPVEISLSPLEQNNETLVMSIIRDISERRAAEELIRASLREKEALLKEIHHRVKNNLQVTSSLVRLQSAVIEDAAVREMFDQTQSRIRSMALVHEKLYQSTNLAQIDFADYVRALGELLFQSVAVDPKRISLEVTGGDMFLTIETAVPCGLIVNELLSNALKHAFPDGRHGRIHVHLENHPDGRRTLVILDDGVGLPPGLVVEDAETLGLRLIHALTEQLDGEIAIARAAAGAKFTVTFVERGR
jgi:PAS domain S-box-containing protein